MNKLMKLSALLIPAILMLSCEHTPPTAIDCFTYSMDFAEYRLNGNFPPIGSGGEFTARTQQELDDLQLSGSLPAVDFSRKMVIGKYLTGGGCSGFEVNSILNSCSKITVNAMLRNGCPGEVCTADIYYYALLLVTDKSELPVEFSRDQYICP